MHLLLVDDHPLFSHGFAHALTHASPQIAVRCAGTLDEGLQLAEKALPDLVLIDYRLGQDNGIEGLRRFGQRWPTTARALISGSEDAAIAAAAKAAGASAFLPKSLSLDQLLASLRAIERGELVFSHGPSWQAHQPTARQLEVLALLAQGQPNKRIASQLAISERTVKLHITGMLELLGANNRTHLVLRARELGLL